LEDYSALADTSLPSGVCARHGTSLASLSSAQQNVCLADDASPCDGAGAAKAVLTELLSRFAAPSAASPLATSELLEHAALCADDDLFVADAAGVPLSCDLLAELRVSHELLLRDAASDATARVIGVRCCATPPAALGLSTPARTADAPTRAGAEGGASTALLLDLQAFGEAALGLDCSSHPRLDSPRPLAISLFSPPLAEQRRALVTALLRMHRPCSILDAGCGAGAFLEAMLRRRLGGVGPQLARLVGIELSPARLAQAAQAVARCAAPGVDVQLLCGSLLDASPPEVDAAVCVEVIEHLASEDEALRAGIRILQLRPRVAIFTTPNADANAALEAAAAGAAALPAGAGSSGRVRDCDHKFEWSVQRCAQWAANVAEQAGGGWAVQQLTVGALRRGVQPAGCVRAGASQAVVFINLRRG
jgi:SAM-dependent methyltransferase